MFFHLQDFIFYLFLVAFCKNVFKMYVALDNDYELYK